MELALILALFTTGISILGFLLLAFVFHMVFKNRMKTRNSKAEDLKCTCIGSAQERSCPIRCNNPSMHKMFIPPEG